MFMKRMITGLATRSAKDGICSSLLLPAAAADTRSRRSRLGRLVRGFDTEAKATFLNSSGNIRVAART
jgi:hypothetical protein